MSGIRSEPIPGPSLVREGRIKAPSPDKGGMGRGSAASPPKMINKHPIGFLLSPDP
jgi:hypothetical protein